MAAVPRGIRTTLLWRPDPVHGSGLAAVKDFAAAKRPISGLRARIHRSISRAAATTRVETLCTRAGVIRWESAATLMAPMAGPIVSQKCASTAVTPRLTRFGITATPASSVMTRLGQGLFSQHAKSRPCRRDPADDLQPLLQRDGSQHRQAARPDAQRPAAAHVQHRVRMGNEPSRRCMHTARR